MKTNALLVAVACLFAVTTSHAQIAASFTVSHAGLMPSPEATVNVGDTIQFIYGSGGPHPMTSGHAQVESPVFFPTVTVTAGTPEAFITLSDPGVYYFHCATNPTNTSNWGTLTVVDPSSSIQEAAALSWTPVSNVVSDAIVVEGQLPARLVLRNLSGQKIQSWPATGQQVRLALPALSSGMYLLTGMQGGGFPIWIQQ